MDRDRDMFGCPKADIDKMVSESFVSPQMLAMSVLSDSQELIARGEANKARQHINIAKYIIQKTMPERGAS